MNESIKITSYDRLVFVRRPLSIDRIVHRTQIPNNIKTQGGCDVQARPSPTHPPT